MCYYTEYQRFSVFRAFVLDQKGSTDFSDTIKSYQWPHLNMNYEATYAVQSIVNEIYKEYCLLYMPCQGFYCSSDLTGNLYQSE